MISFDENGETLKCFVLLCFFHYVIMENLYIFYSKQFLYWHFTEMLF